MSNQNKTSLIFAVLALIALFLMERISSALIVFIENWLSMLIIKSVTIVSASYLDDIHANIGVGVTSHSSNFYTLLYFVFIVGLVLWALSLIISIFNRNRNSEKTKSIPGAPDLIIERKKTSIFEVIQPIAYFFLLSFSIVSVSTLYVKSNYSNKAVIFIERNLDILSAYSAIGDINKLRARYRAINGFCSYKKFETELQEQQIKYSENIKQDGIELPIFNSYTNTDIINCNKG